MSGSLLLLLQMFSILNFVLFTDIENFLLRPVSDTKTHMGGNIMSLQIILLIFPAPPCLPAPLSALPPLSAPNPLHISPPFPAPSKCSHPIILDMTEQGCKQV